MGLHTTSGDLENWQSDNYFDKLITHRLVSHIPSGDMVWEMPLTSEDISWGTSPTHIHQAYHYVWQVNVNGATVIASTGHYPYLATKTYGLGKFIYHAGLQPLVGHGGHAPGMYAYGIFHNAIEWAFESFNLPIVKVSPWPYPYNAAYFVRHDFENDQWGISNIEASAQEENSVGAKGDYYFCTGTLREEIENPSEVVDSLRRAVSLYGATIGPHNGGLKNPNNPSLSMDDLDYWHWGLDEALDTHPPGYASGKAYAQASLAAAFADVNGWLAGLTTNTHTWVSPYFNSTRDASYEILEQLGVITAGEQKLTPFPHWTLSTKTNGKRFSFLSLPVSDWFINGVVRHAIDDGHDVSTIHALVDYYYNLGALINLYSHELSTNALPYEYLHYCAAKSAIWPANAASMFQWWTKRSPVQAIPSPRVVGNRLVVTIAVSGATDSDTAIELIIPNWAFASSDLRVRLNGVAADPSKYRTYHQGIKVKVGTTVSVVDVSYPLTSAAPSALSSVSLNPTSVFGGDPSTGTVALDNPAPVGGAVVSLSSSIPAAAQVPASVTVPVDEMTATFAVTTSPVATDKSVTISGIYNGTTKTATLTVKAPVGAPTVTVTSPNGGESWATGTTHSYHLDANGPDGVGDDRPLQGRGLPEDPGHGRRDGRDLLVGHRRRPRRPARIIGCLSGKAASRTTRTRTSPSCARSRLISTRTGRKTSCGGTMGRGGYQGWNVVWLMHQSGTLSPMPLGANQAGWWGRAC